MKKIYLTYEAETPMERNFEIKVKKWGNLGYFAHACVREVVKPERKFFGRYKYLGEYVYDLDYYDTLEEIAQVAVIKAMDEQENRARVKKMWNGG